MSNPAWGMKRICPSCGTRYYDFQKDPPACPMCGTAYDPEALLKSRRGRTAVVDEPAPKKRAKTAAPAGDEDLPDIDVETPEDADIDEDADAGDSGDDTILEDDADDEDVIEDVEVPEEEN